MKKYHLAFAILTVALTGCTTPTQYSAGLKPLDRTTDYSVVEGKNGFTITVEYDRYQFIPETQALIEGCKSALFNAAYDHAESRGRHIKPINEQRVRLSTGRNGLTGMTSCSASVRAEYN